MNIPTPEKIEYLEKSREILSRLQKEVSRMSYERCLNIIDALLDCKVFGWTIGWDSDSVYIEWSDQCYVISILHEFEDEIPDEDDNFFMIQSLYPYPPEPLLLYNNVPDVVSAIMNKLCFR